MLELTRAQLERMVAIGREIRRRQPWSPLPGPQTLAYESEADVIGFGGAAGGGKTDLACGKAITRHRKVMILRRVGTELTGITDRLEQIINDNRKGWNGKDKIWRLVRHVDKAKVQIELGSLPHLGDEKGFQGRPHDLLVFDEAANFLEAQVRFLMGWVRTTIPGQRCQVLMTFNPPTSAEGRWIVDFFAPWLLPNHPNPALPGELRWFATVKGADVEVPDARRFVLAEDGTRVYDFDPKAHRPEDVITPKSRTFIPSKISDNRFLMGTGYMSQLQALPEPLRSQMLNGDFMAGMGDDPWQVIPTAWVKAAQDRWAAKPVLPEMLGLGVDVARGGDDETIIAPRYEGWWFGELKAFPGKMTPDGHEVATHALMARRDQAPIHVDVIGVGASPYDILRAQKVQVIGVNVAEKANARDKSGLLSFANLRSQLWWQFRELLDPEANTGVALPPDPKLLADLTAPRWAAKGPVIHVESREEIYKRIGRSPDRASAIILAAIETPNASKLERARVQAQGGEYDPYAVVRPKLEAQGRVRSDYDPYG